MTQQHPVKATKPKLLDQVFGLRSRHYSLRTEESYISWIKRHIYFHNKRHPREMGSEEVLEFLNNLAVKRNVQLLLKTRPCAQ